MGSDKERKATATMPKMHGLLEKILEQKARDERECVFHYSSYWGMWSRVLLKHCVGPYNAPEIIEVNLTPINHCFTSNWEKDVKPIVIRAHGTMQLPGSRDLNERHLPPEIEASMRSNLGLELTMRLLTEDFLSIIDLDKLRAFSSIGGGKRLSEIMRG